MRKIMRIIEDFSTQMKKQNISAFAASTAFFLFLSLVPMLIVLCSILPYTPLTEADLVRVVTDLTPEMVDSLMAGMISDIYDRSAGVMSVAIFATLWSAAKGLMALMRGLNAINDVDENRNYFFVRLVASFYTILMLILIILSLLIVVFGNQLVQLLLLKIPTFEYVIQFSMHFRVLFTWLVLTLLLCMIYAFVPNKKLRLKEQIPGAAISAVAWSLFSWGFSIYVGYMQNISVYGSLTIFILSLIWLYFCMYIVMVGAYLNRYFGPVNRVITGSNKPRKNIP